MTERGSASISSRVVVIAITAALYAVAKGITSYVPTPWGVGQFLLFIFVPVFFAIVSDTFAAAIGAGIGTFLGDTLFLTPAGLTNPALSLIAGVPANFIAFLLFGWFVKHYKSWQAFIAGTVGFVTLGNLIAASIVVLFGAKVFVGASVLAQFNPVSIILGFTLFWTSTMIPSILIAIPLLLRSVKPIRGRSRIITYYPSWSGYEIRRLLAASFLYAGSFLILGTIIVITSTSQLMLSGSPLFPEIQVLVVIAAVSLAILGPFVSRLAGHGTGAN
jgi:hypothetical protein